MAKNKAKNMSGESHLGHDLVVLFSGFALAFVVMVIIFELMNMHFHWIGYPVTAGTDVHGAAETPTPRISTGIVEGAAVTLSADKKGDAYASPGQKDVEAMTFNLVPVTDCFLNKIVFHLDRLAHDEDIGRLQLYYDDKLLGETTFFDGRATFDNLMVKLGKNSFQQFGVKAVLGDGARSGDRILLQIISAEDIAVTDNGAEKLEVQGAFPVTGNPVSIIGFRQVSPPAI